VQVSITGVTCTDVINVGIGLESQARFLLGEDRITGDEGINWEHE